MAEYPWYEQILKGETDLQQGDLIKDCPIIIPISTIDTGNIPAKVKIYDVVILSQSCDLEQQNVKFVLVSPVFELSEVRNSFDSKGKFDGFVKKTLRGEQPNYHLLSKSSLLPFHDEALVVDFRNVYAVHIKTLESLASANSRIRLLPPYREHLSQSFARFFMRVGLPTRVELN